MRTPSPAAVLPPRTLLLRDGRSYRLRPLTGADAGLVVEFFGSLSPETIRSRYGYLIRNMTPERAHELVAVAPERELALGILETGPAGREALCAMGRLVVAPDGQAAECAFLVHDRKRRLGMASRLLHYLRLAGRRRGLQRLFAQVRHENRAMLQVFRGAGSQLHFSPNLDFVEIDIPVRKTKFLFDKPPAPTSFPRMASPEKKPFSFVKLAVDLVFTAIAFVIFYQLVNSHVPSSDPKMILFFGASAAACMTGVFWLAMQMLKTVYRFQRDSGK
ncbi:MAG: GNAT family N-acetyltransferase [Opitutae bacterium]|nr:GNAT family N-acetyltransferase [Opitutae bacterium]